MAKKLCERQWRRGDWKGNRMAEDPRGFEVEVEQWEYIHVPCPCPDCPNHKPKE